MNEKYAKSLRFSKKVEFASWCKFSDDGDNDDNSNTYSPINNKKKPYIV